jgi:t-SNARE complex subunit (syntaxin)
MIDNILIKEQLLNSKSTLTLEEQKELADYTIKSATRNSLKTFLIIFPVMIIAMLVMVVGILYFVKGGSK